MADESSDEEQYEDLNVQNGYDGELELYLRGDYESDTSESAGSIIVWRKSLKRCRSRGFVLVARHRKY